MNIAQGRASGEGKGQEQMDSPPLVLDVGRPSGQDYVEAMTIAGEFAYAGREAVIARTLEILGAEAKWSVHNHHNFAWRETHFGHDFWVVRKGATPAFPGQWGFVGGSMGDISVILRGVESAESKSALYSTVHGAGRVMSRTQAAGKQRWMKAWMCGQRNCDGTLPISTSRGADGSSPKCPKCGHRLNRRTWTERSAKGLVDFDAERAKLTARDRTSRRRRRRSTARVPSAAIRARRARGYDRDRAHPAASNRCDGRGRRVRSLQGLVTVC
jgi:tRNA-splicing ligase RtcB